MGVGFRSFSFRQQQLWQLFNNVTRRNAAVRLRLIQVLPKWEEVMLSNPTPLTSSSPTRPLSSSSFYKPLPYNILDQTTAAHSSCIVATEFSQSAASFLEELSPIPSLKTTCRNRRRGENFVRVLTSTENLARTKKRVATRSHREGTGANQALVDQQQVPENAVPPAFVLFVTLSGVRKI
ncbi:hypothetical protein TNCV_659011 [Trichonephila clavipes]|nr:hypothetical protein TNCV_659011 [Trichonephila clavipes]